VVGDQPLVDRILRDREVVVRRRLRRSPRP
jgi:hypothetical protein